MSGPKRSLGDRLVNAITAGSLDDWRAGWGTGDTIDTHGQVASGLSSHYDRGGGKHFSISPKLQRSIDDSHEAGLTTDAGAGDE